MFSESSETKLSSLVSRGLLLGMKTETESEGLPWQEITRLRIISSSLKIPFSLKIGGVEAITDMNLASNIHVDSVIAPMVESKFAASKFFEAASKHLPNVSDRRILIETELGIKSLKNILDFSERQATGVNFGRSDLASSLSIESNKKCKQDSLEVTSRLNKAIELCKEHDFETTIGGGITQAGLDFMRDHLRALPNRFETRRFIFSAEKVFEEGDALVEILTLELEMISDFVGVNNGGALRASTYAGELESRLRQGKPRDFII